MDTAFRQFIDTSRTTIQSNIEHLHGSITEHNYKEIQEIVNKALDNKVTHSPSDPIPKLTQALGQIQKLLQKENYILPDFIKEAVLSTIRTLSSIDTVERPREEIESFEPLKEPTEYFFSLFNQNDLKEAQKCVAAFDSATKLPSLLWVFTKNTPTKELPYEIMAYEDTPNDPDTLTFSKYVYDKFVVDLATTKKGLLDLMQQPSLRKYPEVLDLLEKIYLKCSSIQIDIAAHADKEKIRINKNAFTKWKIPPEDIINLRKLLEKIELEEVLEFLASLAVLTIRRGTDEGNHVQDGLFKLRDYICSRDVRMKNLLGRNECGVATSIFNYCFDRVFNLPQAEYNYSVSKGLISINTPFHGSIPVAQAVNTGGHFVTLVNTHQGMYKLDTSGNRAQGGKSGIEQFYEGRDKANQIFLSDKFHRASKKIDIGSISVPQQKNNNCYLVGGWIPFCMLLHYHNELKGGVPEKKQVNLSNVKSSEPTISTQNQSTNALSKGYSQRQHNIKIIKNTQNITNKENIPEIIIIDEPVISDQNQSTNALSKEHDVEVTKNVQNVTNKENISVKTAIDESSKEENDTSSRQKKLQDMLLKLGIEKDSFLWKA